MIDTQFGFDPLAPFLAVVVALIALGAALFVTGRPADLDRARWRIWAIGGLAMLALIFFLTWSLDNLPYQPCGESADVEC